MMRDMWEGLGLSMFILALCLGPSGCYCIVKKAESIEADTQLKLQQIEKEKKP